MRHNQTIYLRGVEGLHVSKRWVAILEGGFQECATIVGQDVSNCCMCTTTTGLLPVCVYACHF